MEKPAALGKGQFSVEWMAQSSCRSPEPRPGCERVGDRSQEAGVVHGTWDTPRTPRTQTAGGTARGSHPQHTPPQTSPEDRRDSRKSPDSQAEEAGSEGTRPRTKFSSQQLQELERSFQKQRYIGVNEKRRLARVLELSELRIKTWFQNRRMKFKRQSQDARVEAFFSGLLQPYAGYPEVQAPEVLPRNSWGVPVSPPSLPPTTSNTTPVLPSYGLPGMPPVPFPAMGLYSYPTPLPFPGEYPSHRYHPYYPS